MLSERKRLVKQLDRVFSLYIRKRDGYCVVCGSSENLQNGHLLSRVAYSTRWDETNCNCQCRGCNYNHEFRPQAYTAWWIGKYGKKKYHELVKKHNTTRKFSNVELKAMIKKYKELI